VVATRAVEGGTTLLAAPHDQAAWRRHVAHLRGLSRPLVGLWAPLDAAR